MQEGNFLKLFFSLKFFIIVVQEGNSHPIPLPAFGGVGSTPSASWKVCWLAL
jgi:hypothetical protein